MPLVLVHDVLQQNDFKELQFSDDNDQQPFGWDHTLRASEQHEAMNLAPIAAYSLGRSGIIGFDIRMRFRLFVSRQQAFGEGRSN